MTNQTTRPAPPRATPTPTPPTNAAANATPKPPADPPKEEPTLYGLKLYARSAEGFVVEFTASEQVRPIVWAKALSKGMKEQGFMPVDPFPNIDVDVAAGPASAPPAAAGNAQAGGDTDWVPNFCPECGKGKETFYDNRNDPARPANGPLFKCKECGHGFYPPRPAGQRGRR